MREARRTPGSPILLSPPGSGGLEWGGGARPIRTRLPRTPSQLVYFPRRRALALIHFPQTPGANSVRLAPRLRARRSRAAPGCFAARSRSWSTPRLFPRAARSRRPGLVRSIVSTVGDGSPSPSPLKGGGGTQVGRAGAAPNALVAGEGLLHPPALPLLPGEERAGVRRGRFRSFPSTAGVHFPQTPGANSVRLAPRFARGAVAPSGLLRSPVPDMIDTSFAAGCEISPRRGDVHPGYPAESRRIPAIFFGQPSRPERERPVPEGDAERCAGRLPPLRSLGLPRGGAGTDAAHGGLRGAYDLSFYP